MPDSCRLAVVGAGPAGRAAAFRAVELGLDAVLVAAGADPGIAGVRFLEGTGRLAGPGRLEVERDGTTRSLGAEHVILATGTAPLLPPGFPDGGERLDFRLPAECGDGGSWIVVGAGPAGAAAAGALAAAGCGVILVERADRILPGCDGEIADLVGDHLRAGGVRILTGRRATGAEVDGGPVRCLLRRTADRARSVETADRILVAAGGRPRTRGLGLETVDVLTDRRGFIQTDAFMATTQPGIHAVGGVVPTTGGAEAAVREARTAVDHLAGRPVRPVRYDHIARHLDTRPPVSWVGPTEGAAREAGYLVGVGRFRSGAAAAGGPAPGFGKVVADRESGRLLGVHLAGAGAPAVVDAVARALAAADGSGARDPALEEAGGEVAAALADALREEDS